MDRPRLVAIQDISPPSAEQRRIGLFHFGGVMKYSEKLKDPRWQKKRLEILQRDTWACQLCGDTESMLTIHHKYYKNGLEPWEYPDESLVTLCENCHKDEYECRAGREELLLRAFREAGWFSEDIFRIAEAVHDMPMLHMSVVIATAYARAFGNKEIQQRLIDEVLTAKKPENI